ncbi:hypothetical protein BU204_13040 [Actinophytocola xanthii]|uniref:HTH cro/C1-type domain-containing protein n=2 Tax=Actinophytocola xanthii TaxID=1912961 RepID=A0A1Q8BQQ2_9PSEU|nr:helix-turn-helix transcriptional regulator [Actinophytocola xanthii]OLF04427.1 hypothetical protein BU204_37720 [Actinophytocola xanthii]OLF17024.1 hypothetical protein BU204_13040 [Actinophytocola xanthii]
MPRRSPGARAVGIGAELRVIREGEGLSLRQLAKRAGWEVGRLSRIETGKQKPTVADVATLLAILGVTGEQRERILDEVQAVDEPGWWERHLGMTKESAALADYESRAIEITDWAPLVIPGLLQTMDYAAACMETIGIASNDIGSRISARRERQRAVADTPYTAYIGETALRTVVGSPRVLAAQLRMLLANHDSAPVRVVPADAPGHPGQFGGFLMLSVVSR